MKHLEEDKYDEDFDEFETLLIDNLNIASPKAKVVVYIIKHKKSTVRQMCSKLVLHQPQVSVLCNKMVNEGILEVSFEKMTQGRGRKANVYRLAASPVATMNKLLSPVVIDLDFKKNLFSKQFLKQENLANNDFIYYILI